MNARLPTIFMAVAVGLSVRMAHALDCGNPPLTCIPMYGLHETGSTEKQNLDKLYNELVRLSDNDRDKLYNSSFATAVRQVLDRANDETIDFWVLVLNGTDQKHTAVFYVGRTEKPFGRVRDLVVRLMDPNCGLDRSLCSKSSLTRSYQEEYFDYLWRDLKASGKLEAKFNIEVEPNSVVARGYSASIPEESSDHYPVGLFGGQAARRITLDRRDLLRIGLVRAP